MYILHNAWYNAFVKNLFGGYSVYKSSFNGLEISVKGIYAAYNLSSEDLYSLKRKFDNKVNGSNGNYIAYQNAERKVLLMLFVHDVWIPIVVDIRNDLLKLYGSNRLFKKDIDDLSRRLKEMRLQLKVDFSINTHQWILIDYDSFLETLSNLISEQQNAG